MKTQYYRQCKLQLDKGDGTLVITTSWIPEKKAVLGKLIFLEPRGEERTGPWEVIFVGSHRQEATEVMERSQDHKKQRKYSDA